MNKPYKQPILTTYSDLWVNEEHRTNDSGETIMYRPDQFIVTYKNKHMGICVDIQQIPREYHPTAIMKMMSRYAGKHVVNLSVITSEYEVVDGKVDRNPLETSTYTTPIFSKKGTNLMQIDVNFLAILTIGDMWELQEKWMSDSLSYFGQEWRDRKTHANLFAPDSYLRRATHWTEDNSNTPYISPMRPSLKQTVGWQELI